MTKQLGGRRRRIMRRPYNNFNNANNNNNNNVVQSIHSLPRELVVDVLARLASRSLDDFFNAKSSCQEWKGLGDDRYVYKHASLAKIPTVQGWVPGSEKERKKTLFFQECINAGNLEALYRTGVVGYLGCKEPENALECLKKAANAGHIGALNAICIISIFLGGEYKKNGIMVLSKMKESKEQRKEVKKVRQKLKSIIKQIWVRNFLIYTQKPTCCTATDHHTIKNTGWRSVDSDDEDSGVECSYCKCDIEISYVYKALPRLLG